MYFAQQIYDIDYTDLVQHLISLHFNHDYENICKILKIKYEPNREQQLDEHRYNINNLPLNKYYNKGMIFLEDENPVVIQRVNMDKETSYFLNILLLTSSKMIKESCFINLIIEKWASGNFVKSKSEAKNVFTVGDCSRISIEVGQKSWSFLLKMCTNNRISLKDGFKMSIMQYFNEIYNNINTNLIH